MTTSSYAATLAMSSVIPDDVCGVFEIYTDPSTLCARRATHVGTAACLHEHIITGGVCDRHLKTVIDLDGTAKCVHCLTGPEPHDCPVSVTVLPV